MSAYKAVVTIGTKITWDGGEHVVTGFVGASVQLRSARGRVTQTTIAALVEAPDFLVHRPEAAPVEEPAPCFLDNLPETRVENAKSLLEHLLEVRTGFRMGSRAAALPGEPREQYDPGSTSVTQRLDNKARELGCTRRWLYELGRRFDQHGLYGLVDGRTTKIADDRTDSRVKAALGAVLDELTDLSNVSKNQIARRTNRRLKSDYPGEVIPLPSQATYNRLIDRVSEGRGVFASGKARRSIANRPSNSYSHFTANRPGELVLIDSTPLDAFALDPYSFQWVRLQLTIAYDLCTRSLLAWRFTPVSTKAVDAALLLYDMLRPKTTKSGWSGAAAWAYVGVPTGVVIEILGEADASAQLAGIPFVHPESVLIDRGRVFLSQAFTDACTRLGINIFIARPYTPTDKAHVERVFRSIRQAFVENLPGYIGPDLFSRGAQPEATAYFFLDEIESRFGEWVATYWQRRHHEGLELPHLPRLHLSPNNMYEIGIARAGLVHLLAEENLYYDLLPTEWRTIQHYGVEVRGLRYDGDILNEFRNQKSPYTGLNAGKWPVRYDPRDHSHVFFYDHTLREWHALRWTGHTEAPRPFDAATLSHAKSLVVSRGGNPRDHDEMVVTLNELLDRLDVEVVAGRKERRIAAINAIQRGIVQRDQPKMNGLVGPDAESSAVTTWLDEAPDLVPKESESDAGSPIPRFRTVSEAMEEDDELVF
jgi:transposase InsO family protein